MTTLPNNATGKCATKRINVYQTGTFANANISSGRSAGSVALTPWVNGAL